MNTLNDLFNNGQPKMKPAKPAPDYIILPSTRDELHNTLMNRLRLNRYDLRFMANINEKYLSTNKALSPGQNELYEKIIHKYRKQFRKLGARYTDILALPWKNGIISLDVLNQKTYFRIKDNEMQLYFNFNKAQIEEVRALIHDDAGQHLNRAITQNFGNGQKYEFTWNNTTKAWAGPFNVYLFKNLYEFAKRAGLIIDTSVTDLIESIEVWGTKEDWTPSIRIVHDRIYVSHLTETMLSKLETIDPTDLSVHNIERLSELGLAVPEQFAHIAYYLRGSSPQLVYDVKDAADVATLKDYIAATGRKVLFDISAVLVRDKNLSHLLELANCETWGNCKIAAPPSTKQLELTTPSYLVEMFDKLKEEGYNTLVTTTTLTSHVHSQSPVGRFALVADKMIYIKLHENK